MFVLIVERGLAGKKRKIDGPTDEDDHWNNINILCKFFY